MAHYLKYAVHRNDLIIIFPKNNAFKRIYWIVYLLLITKIVYAQYEPLYSQYIFNGTILNPAYPLMDAATQITAMYRHQWVGLHGAPRTSVLNGSLPIGEEARSNVGLMMVHDQIGVTSELSVNMLASQSIKLSDEVNIGLGLSGGFSFYNEDYNKLRVTELILLENKYYTNGTIGFGAIVYAKNFFVGFSVPSYQKLNVEYSEINNGLRANANVHYYLNAGFVTNILGEDVQFKPTILLKKVGVEPIRFEGNASVHIQNTLWTGLGWRYGESLIGFIQMQILPSLQFSYSYDFVYASHLRDIQSGSHELSLNYRFVKDSLAPKCFF